MLSYKNENGKVKELAAGGTMGELLAESAYLLGSLWHARAQRQGGGGDFQGEHDDGRGRPGIAGMEEH